MLIKSKKPMAVAALKNAIDNNPLLMKAEKFFKDDGYKISHAKIVMELIAEKKIVEASKKFLEALNDGLKQLPKDDLHSVHKATTYIVMLKKTLFDLHKIVNFTNQFFIDDPNTKKVIDNSKKGIDVLNTMIDYMEYVLKTHLIIEELKTSPKLSAEELKAKIAA